jgi:hypothetical protein
MPFKYYIIYMKPLYRQNNHYIGKSTTSRLTYRLVTKSVPCRLDSTYRLENLGQFTYTSTLPPRASLVGHKYEIEVGRNLF